MRILPLLALIQLAAAVPVYSQPAASAQAPASRYALVIGNGNYADLSKLRNPSNDAADVAASLKGLGFEVELLVDADLPTMEDAVLRLGSRLSTSSNATGFFFYAGHGVQSGGINYLVPADARIPGEAYLKTKALAAQSVLETLQSAKNGLNLVVLDACRDNPFGWARSGNRGLTVVGNQPPGSIVVYATGAGGVAQDGSGRNGIFTGELLKHLAAPGLEISEVFKRTGAGVQAATRGQQNPAVYSQFFGSAYLSGAQAAQAGSQPVSLAAAARPADAMIVASEAGADIFVDGVPKGKAPLLVQGLPTDRSVKIEVRGAKSAGSATVSLKPGELREIAVPMAPFTGNLVISSNEIAVRLLLDGQDRGPYGSGVFRDLPAGDHLIELVGQGLYFAKTASIQAEATTQLTALVRPVGGIEIRAPADAKVVVRGVGFEKTVSGNASIANLPEGTYRLESEGGDYLAASTAIVVKKGDHALWEPCAKGAIEFEVTPSGATCVLAAGRVLPAQGRATDIAPGAYRALLRKPGYKDVEMPVVVAGGKLATLKAGLVALKPGSLLVPSLGFDASIMVDGEKRTGKSGPEGMLLYDGLPSGTPLLVSLSIPGQTFSSLDMTVTLREGEAVRLDLPAGRFTLPWVADDTKVSIQGREAPADGAPGYRSPLLPAGSYEIAVRGKYFFFGRAEIRPGVDTEVPGYREELAGALSLERAKLRKAAAGSATKKTIGYVSLATGITGVAGAAASYFLGAQAASDYAKAGDTDTARDRRLKVEMYSVVLPITAVAGALGLGLAPFLLAKGPDAKTLQLTIDALDEQIKSLKK